MKNRLILFIALIPSLTCEAQTLKETDEKQDSVPMVILLGDSIRMNYQQDVITALANKAEVWSPKENCKHTVFMLENLEKWLTDRKPQVVHVNVGLHDMYLDAKTGKPRHTIESYEENLRAIFAKIDKLTDAKVIFALTTAVDEQRQADSKSYGRVVRRNTDIQAYNNKAREVAKEMDITINDLNAFMVKTGTEKILRPSDGIHLSSEGCRLVGRHVSQVILKQLPAGE